MTGSESVLEGHSWPPFGEGVGKRHEWAQSTSWEMSVGNRMREDRNLVWGGEVKMPFTKFHMLAPSVASLQKWKGDMGMPRR